jgi:hypothetical protein
MTTRPCRQVTLQANGSHRLALPENNQKHERDRADPFENDVALDVRDKVAERRRINSELSCQTGHVGYMDARVGWRTDKR